MSVAMADSHFQPGQSEPPIEVRLTRMPNGRLRDDGADASSRNIAMASHLLGLLLFITVLGPLAFIVPMIMWLANKDNPFVDDHGKEHMNLWITGVIMTLLMATVVLIPFVIVWYIVAIINAVRATIAASNGEYFRYPMVLRIVS